MAEIGGNFSTYDQGRKLINSAISCGANAVKIQSALNNLQYPSYVNYEILKSGTDG